MNNLNTYKVRGSYTISWEMEVLAENREEAEDIGYNLDIQTEYNGNSVFVYDGNAELCADGMPFNIEVELIEGEEEEDEDEE